MNKLMNGRGKRGKQAFYVSSSTVICTASLIHESFIFLSTANLLSKDLGIPAGSTLILSNETFVRVRLLQL